MRGLSKGIPAYLINYFPELVFQSRDSYLPFVPVGLTSLTLADKSCNAPKASVS